MAATVVGPAVEAQLGQQLAPPAHPRDDALGGSEHGDGESVIMVALRRLPLDDSFVDLVLVRHLDVVVVEVDQFERVPVRLDMDLAGVTLAGCVQIIFRRRWLLL